MTSGSSPGFIRPIRPIRPTRPPVRPASIDIDLHGMTKAEAAVAAEAHIRQAHAARLHIVKIIHGHGTGAVRSTVQKVLDDSPLVKRHYLASHGDGGHGATIAELDYGQRGFYDNPANNGITPRAERRR
ncbi:MAG: Smr/MutS family protein [Chloroflexi bacterium]|nr:Smr/MutS family protein [Chloroflexota bacterium]